MLGTENNLLAPCAPLPGLKHVTLILNNLEPDTWTRHEVPDIRDFLMEQFDKFPANARIYHGAVSQVDDVTPHNEKDIEVLGELPGPFFVIVFPEGPIAYLAVGILLAAAAYLLIPPIPNLPQRNQQAASPNNELSDRTNVARINGRIPDIYGTVRSTPDLISAPYKVFENGREKEHAYMCIGRGPYVTEDVRDGDTLISKIPGSSIEVYGPYTSPNSGDDPELRIGAPINEALLSTKRCNSVNGQILRPPSSGEFVGNKNIFFGYPNQIRLNVGNANIDFQEIFGEGDTITVSNASVVGTDPWQLEYIRHVSKWDIQTPSDAPAPPEEHGAFARRTGSLVFKVFAEDSHENILAKIQVGATLEITQTSFVGEDGSVTTIDLSGTYEVAEVNSYPIYFRFSGADRFVRGYIEVMLDAPELVNSDWDRVDTEVDHYLGNSMIIESGANDLTADFAGTYTILNVTETTITLDNPAGVNSDWNLLSTPNISPLMSPTLSVDPSPRWQGPFILDDPSLSGAIFNFFAQNGLYKDDGLDQVSMDVEIRMEVTRVDLADAPLGPPQFFTTKIFGSPSDKSSIGLTYEADFFAVGRCSVRVARITETDDVFEGTVVDEVRWRDLYSVAPVSKEDFGNVTTVRTVTYATASALAVKERKLNMLVSRKIPAYAAGEFDDVNLAITKDTALILAAICRDKYIGNRSVEEFDMENFVDTAAEVETYFGTPVCRRFSYTFDKDNMSFEETVNAVAAAMFCVAYRRGNVIRLSFEKETNDSTLLFNHRNKIPNTEIRAVSFGSSESNDGIQFTYIDPFDDSINTIFLPEEYAAVNPKKIDSIGIRSHLHAYFQAWRAWNKIQYRSETVQFDACQEADLLVRNDRVLVSDGTRLVFNEGEVMEVDGTELTLSQAVDLATDPPYTIFLQHVDGTVENIGCTAGTESSQVVLSSAPAQALVTDPNKSVRTGFIIVGDNDPRQMAFLVDEKSPSGNMTSTVKAYNYDARYYGKDLDYINELVGDDAYGTEGGYTPPEDGDTGYIDEEPPAAFELLAVAMSLSPSLALYNVADFSRLPDVAVAPPGSGNRVAISPDGTLLAIGCAASPYLALYDTATWTRLPDPASIPDNSIRALAFSPDSSMLVVSFGGGTSFYIYNTSTWGTITGPTSGVTTFETVAFSPDGSLLVFTSFSGTPPQGLHVYATSTWAPVTGIADGLRGAGGNDSAFSPDGTEFAVVHAGSARVTRFNTSTWARAALLASPPADEASGLAYSNDGTKVAISCYDDPKIKIYSFPGWSLITDIAITDGDFYPSRLRFSNDDSKLVYVGGGGTASSMRALSTTDWTHLPDPADPPEADSSSPAKDLCFAP